MEEMTHRRFRKAVAELGDAIEGEVDYDEALDASEALSFLEERATVNKAVTPEYLAGEAGVCEEAVIVALKAMGFRVSRTAIGVRFNVRTPK